MIDNLVAMYIVEMFVRRAENTTFEQQSDV